MAATATLALALYGLAQLDSFSSTELFIGSAWVASAILGFIFGEVFRKPKIKSVHIHWSATLAALIGSLSATTIFFSGRTALDPSFMGACVSALGFATGVGILGVVLPKRELNYIQLSYRFAAGGAAAIIISTAIPLASQFSLSSQHPVGMIRLAMVAVMLPSAYLFILNNRGAFTSQTLGGVAVGVLLGTMAAPFAFSIHIWVIIISAGILALTPNRGALQRLAGCGIAAAAIISAPNTNTFRLIGSETGWSENALTVGAVSFAREGSSPSETVRTLIGVMNTSTQLYTSISSNGASAVFRGSNQELVAILDGFVHQSNSRESDAVRLTPHLGAALTTTPTAAQRALVLADPLGFATEGLIEQGYTDISVSVPNPAHYRALAGLSTAFETTMLHPSVQLLPHAKHEILGSTGGLDLIIDSASTPWHDSFQGIPTSHQLQKRSRSLSDSGVHVISFDLGWIRGGHLKTLLESFQENFVHSWAFLPPNGGDQMIVASWNGDNQIQWNRFVDATARGSSILRELEISSPIDLADRAVFRISESPLSTVAPERLTALSITRINQRPQMLWPIFSSNFVSPAELFQEDLDSALIDLLNDRLESNLAFLQLLETTSRGEMGELFEASRTLQGTAAGDRALNPLVAPYLVRARGLIELAAQEGPASEFWGEAQGELAAALLLHPNSVEGIILSAEVSLGVGQTNTANTSYGRALQIAPNDAAAALGVAHVSMLRRDLPRAERVLERAHNYHPSNWLIAYNLAIVLKEKGDTDRAEELLRDATGLSDDTEAAPHTALAELYLSTGEATSALVEASRAMTLTPSAHNSYIQGKAFYEVEQFEQAELAFQQAVLGDASMWQARAGLGLIYALKGDYSRCVSAFSDVISASPNNPMAMENRDRCIAAID